MDQADVERTEAEMLQYIAELRAKVAEAKKTRQQNDDDNAAILREIQQVNEETQRYRAELTNVNLVASEANLKRMKNCVDHMKLQRSEREKLVKAGKESDAKLMAEYEQQKQYLLQLTKESTDEELEAEFNADKEELRAINQKSTEVKADIEQLKVAIEKAKIDAAAQENAQRELLKQKALKVHMAKERIQLKKDELAAIKNNNRLKEATKELLDRENKRMRKQLEERARKGLQNLHLDKKK